VEENDGCCLDEYVNGRFPYLLPSLCNTVLAIALLFIVFQLPVCAVLNFLGFLLTLCYKLEITPFVELLLIGHTFEFKKK
jgi:hypothetical protein